MKQTVTINFASLGDSIEKQLADQGLQHEKSDKFELERKALHRLYFSNAITEAELIRIEKRLFKRWTNGLKVLKHEEVSSS